MENIGTIKQNEKIFLEKGLFRDNKKNSTRWGKEAICIILTLQKP